MAYEKVYLCDLCEEDGEKNLSVATYTNDKGEEYSCCVEHLSDVKKCDLKFDIIEEMEYKIEEDKQSEAKQ